MSKAKEKQLSTATECITLDRYNIFITVNSSVIYHQQEKHILFCLVDGTGYFHSWTKVDALWLCPQGAWRTLISNYGYNRNSRSCWYMDCHWIFHCTARSTARKKMEMRAGLTPCCIASRGSPVESPVQTKLASTLCLPSQPSYINVYKDSPLAKFIVPDWGI